MFPGLLIYPLQARQRCQDPRQLFILGQDQKTQYKPARDPPRVAATAMPAGFYAAICCYASVKLSEPLHGLFMFYRYVNPKRTINAIQRILELYSDFIPFYYIFVTYL